MSPIESTLYTYVIYTLDMTNTMTGGSDHDVFSVPLLFPIGSTPGLRQCFNIQDFINDDIMVEMTENFRIMLTTTDPSAEFRPGRDCATINIMDNDREYNSYELCYNYKLGL